MNKKSQLKVSPIEANVMGKIKNGEAAIKPYSHYVVLGALGVVSLISLSVIASYFISIISLWARIQAAKGPAYGAKQNLILMMGDFPWLSLVFGIVSVVAIIYTVKKLGFAYKIRLVYLIPLIMSVLVVLGFILSYSSLPSIFNNHRDNPRCNSNFMECRPFGLSYKHK